MLGRRSRTYAGSVETNTTRQTMPTANRIPPATTSGPCPKRCAALVVRMVTTGTNAGPGTRARPVCSALQCHTSWHHSTLDNSMIANATPNTNVPVPARPNRGRASRCSSSSGVACRADRRANHIRRNHRHRQQPEGARGRPSPRGRLHQRARHRCDGHGHQNCAPDVGQRAGLAGHGTRQHGQPGEQGQHADRQVDHENPAPVDLDQQPAQHRPGRGRQPTHRSPAAGGRRAPVGRNGGQQQGQRGRQLGRGADGLDDSSKYEHPQRRRHRATQ